ncbi:hypothetical protein MPSEU_000759800 [Mayamaea pseudoterrestris]|nr:hypothetical protein MPSEU_000759800 [Mayamaea pseudoterrestris]
MSVNDLFERVDKENPDENSHYFVLKPKADVTAVSFSALRSFAADKITFLSPALDCCMTTYHQDLPMNLTYTLDLVVASTVPAESHNANDTLTLQLAATSVNAAEQPLNNLLECIATSQENSRDAHCSFIDVTIKAFATSPRQLLPSITTPTISKLTTLRLHFVSMSTETAMHLMNHVSELECKQSTVLNDGFGAALRQAERMKTCRISCTQADLLAIGPGLAAATTAIAITEDAKDDNDTNSPASTCCLKHLYLTCHFWLMGQAWDALLHGFANNQSLESLSIAYLDIGDAEWINLMKSLHAHPRLTCLNMTFTDNFVDDYRRMTTERRATRSVAVLELVQANANLVSVQWPAFQQDEHVMESMNALLAARVANGI